MLRDIDWCLFIDISKEPTHFIFKGEALTLKMGPISYETPVTKY